MLVFADTVSLERRFMNLRRRLDGRSSLRQRPTANPGVTLRQPTRRSIAIRRNRRSRAVPTRLRPSEAGAECQRHGNSRIRRRRRITPTRTAQEWRTARRLTRQDVLLAHPKKGPHMAALFLSSDEADQNLMLASI
jgi:hypothetical protein